MSLQHTSVQGPDVLPTLAKIYPQLYLQPGPEGEKWYHEIVACGKNAPDCSLGHFQQDQRDTLQWEKTPAGEVMVITLYQRKDFELFFQIMAKRCRPDPVPATQGAATLDGVINWTKIREHQQAFLLEAALAGIDSPNWKDE